MRKLSVLVALALACTSVGSAQESNSGLYDNPPGWTWLIQPMPAGSTSWSSNGVLAESRQTCEGGYEITVAFTKESGSDYRAVAFDDAGHRHELSGHGGGSGDLALMTYSAPFAELVYTDVQAVGVEVLSREGWPAASAEAAGRAQEAGVKTLPLPRLGELYQFELVSVDGVSVSSAELRGKVVIVDCWATWCTPCMKKMPQLKSYLGRWQEQGLEIVGVNFDRDLEKARRTIESNGLNWPQVGIPADQTTRKIWWEVSSISALPHLLIINREGVLVYDGRNMEEIEEKLEGLFGGT